MITWRKTAKAIRERDGNKCRCCGAEKRLPVHHIKSKIRGGTDDPKNLITLCNKCHRSLELKSQWREWKKGISITEAFWEVFKEKKDEN